MGPETVHSGVADNLNRTWAGEQALMTVEVNITAERQAD